MYFYLDLNHSEFIRDDVPSEGTVEEEDKVFMLRVSARFRIGLLPRFPLVVVHSHAPAR